MVPAERNDDVPAEDSGASHVVRDVAHVIRTVGEIGHDGDQAIHGAGQFASAQDASSHERELSVDGSDQVGSAVPDDEPADIEVFETTLGRPSRAKLARALGVLALLALVVAAGGAAYRFVDVTLSPGEPKPAAAPSAVEPPSAAPATITAPSPLETTDRPSGGVSVPLTGAPNPIAQDPAAAEPEPRVVSTVHAPSATPQSSRVQSTVAKRSPKPRAAATRAGPAQRQRSRAPNSGPSNGAPWSEPDVGF